MEVKVTEAFIRAIVDDPSALRCAQGHMTREGLRLVPFLLLDRRGHMQIDDSKLHITPDPEKA
jgi:hypothetical protein